MLYLGYNNILNIKVLEEVRFDKLVKLYLSKNIIKKTKDLNIPNLKDKIFEHFWI